MVSGIPNDDLCGYLFLDLLPLEGDIVRPHITLPVIEELLLGPGRFILLFELINQYLLVVVLLLCQEDQVFFHNGVLIHEGLENHFASGINLAVGGANGGGVSESILLEKDIVVAEK